MKTSLKTTLLMLGFIALNAIQALAQTGVVSGQIVDKSTGEFLFGATVSVEGTTTATTCDFDGKYSLKLQPGTYRLICTYISYQKMTITDLVIEAGKVVTLDFAMEQNKTDLKEVVIEARVVKSTDASLIAIQKKAYAVQDGVSSQQIGRTGSANAAEGMKQMSGANVEDGKFMVMRGLGDRYSIAQINGLPMPSSDPYRNASSLDLIPSGFIDNIITVKTFTPDQPGNFAGGNVNITTKSFPDKLYVNFSVNQSYNTQSSLSGEFMTYQGGAADWRGADDGTRAMPQNLQNDSTRNQLNTSLYLLARNKKTENESARQLFDESSKSFSNNYDPYAVSNNNQNGIGYQMRQILGVNNQFNKTPLNATYNFSLGNKWDIGKQQLGFTTGAVYTRNYSYYKDGNVNTFINAGSDSLFAYQALKETKSVDNPQIGALANLSLKINKNNTIGITGMYSNDAEKISREQSGSFQGQVSDSRSVFNTRVQEFTQRELKTIVINGLHAIPLLHGLDIEWSGSNTKSRQYEPDLRYFAYTAIRDSVDSLDADGNLLFKYPDTVYYMNNAEFAFPYHFYRDLNDNQVQGKLDFTLTLNENQTAKIKAGVYYGKTTRDFKEYRYQMNNSGVTGITLDKFNGNIDSLMDDSNFGIIDTSYLSNGTLNRYVTGWHYINQVNLRNFYSGNQTIQAAYVMGIFNPLKNLKVIGGVRVESTNMLVTTKDTTKINYVQLNGDTVKDPGKVVLTDFLPSLNLVYELNENTNLRAAFAQTLARPNMRELAPFAQFDPKNGFFNVGNPGLKRTLINNFDLRYEYYPKPGEIIAVSAYYKTFKDPIIRAFNPKATIPELTFINVDQAEIMGLEFEFRKSLGMFHDGLKDFFLNTNLTIIKSRVDVPQNEIDNAKNVDSTFQLSTRPFQGQSPYIINAILSYVNQEFGHESALSFNVSGQKLYSISMFATPDIYEKPVPVLNFKTSQQLGKYWIVSFSARNLLNSSISKTQLFRGGEYIAESFRLGRTFSLGLAFRIK
jgi:TonB-dependent receptor